ERAAPLATGASPGARQRLSGPGEAALGRGPGRSTGAEDRPAGAGDRFFEGVLAAHRRAAEAAGLKWTTAVYDQIQTQRDGDQGLRVERMCELAGVNRAGLYRFRPEPSGPDPDMTLRDAIQRIALE